MLQARMERSELDQGEVLGRSRYGHEVTSENDPFITQMKEAAGYSVSVGPPGGTLVDLFPIRMWIVDHQSFSI